MHRFPVLAVLALLPAIASGETGPMACTLSAWSTGTAAEGREVHAGAASGTPVIARLPGPIHVGGESYKAEVSIGAARDGWFRIDEAWLDDYASDAAPEVVFKGRGWVPGRFLGLGLNDSRLRRAPSADAPIVARLAGTDGDGLAVGADAFVVERLVDCRGRWVEVEGTFLGTPLRGWARGTCANQVTTCP